MGNRTGEVANKVERQRGSARRLVGDIGALGPFVNKSSLSCIESRRRVHFAAEIGPYRVAKGESIISWA